MRDGLLHLEHHPTGITQTSQWRVVEDPILNLEKLKENLLLK